LGRDEEGVVVARVDGDDTSLGETSGKGKAGKGDGIRARRNKPATEGGTGVTPGKAAPAPVVTPAPKSAAPSGSRRPREAVSQTGNKGATKAPVTAKANTGGQKCELADKGGRPRPEPAKRSAVGPTTSSAESVQVAGVIQEGLGDGKDSGELEILSARIAKEQKRGESIKQIEERYSKLNSAFRRRILNDDIRRNVQSQQARGINVRALVININRRSIRSPGGAATRSGIRLRDSKALPGPRPTTESAPVSESTTRQATQPADTSR